MKREIILQPMDPEALEATLALLQMSETELLLVFSSMKKWHCCVAGCDRMTRVQDFGISPLFRWRKDWADLSRQIFLCAKHWQYYKRVPERLKYKDGPGVDHLGD